MYCTMQMKETVNTVVSCARTMSVSGDPKYTTSHRPLPLCVDHHCASVWDTSLCQRITLADTAFFLQHSGPCSCRGWHCIHPLTQHCGEESIETAVTADHHRESELCFLLNEGAVTIQQRRASQCRTQLFRFDSVFSGFIYPESLSLDFWMDTCSVSYWFTTTFKLFRYVSPVTGAAVLKLV